MRVSSCRRNIAAAVLEVDAGTRQVNFFPLTRKGAAFRTEYKVFLAGDDPWFRPVDACAGPDGSVFVADWYDAGVGGHAFSDQTTGRIYRVAPKGHKSQKVKADFATPTGLIAALKSPNIATQDAARRGLDRAGQGSRTSAPTSATWRCMIPTRSTGLGLSGSGTRSREIRSRWPR